MQGFNDIPLNKSPSPCKGCPVRALGCHSTCDAYIAYRVKCDEVIAERGRKRDVDEYICQTMKRMPGTREI